MVYCDICNINLVSFNFKKHCNTIRHKKILENKIQYRKCEICQKFVMSRNYGVHLFFSCNEKENQKNLLEMNKKKYLFEINKFLDNMYEPTRTKYSFIFPTT